MPTTLEPETEMGRVTTQAKIENLWDLYDLSKGRITPDQVRFIEVKDALIDTGCTAMGLPKRYVEQLGLTFVREQPTIAATGLTPAKIFGTVLVTIQGRDCKVDVTELSDDCDVIIGQIPLEYMDFIVDPRGRKLIGNPAHNGQQVFEMI